jgi:FlaA1/EpsC-like NDP-sugar epimerase/lipopolysaccharide/colanic/teichoic acid biosynthesis glycosyltransferase
MRSHAPRIEDDVLLRSAARRVRAARATKRLVDIVLAAAGLLALAPLLLLVAVAVWLERRGPVLFRQERVGRDFHPFRILKFRTMSAEAASRGPAVTARGDPRVTRVGRFLRRTKIDELPQLLNVLRGEMSLVGPRPEVPRFVQRFEDDYREILKVRPGLTDLASIVYRQEESLLARAEDAEEEYVRSILPDKIRLARTYVANASILYDLRLILETLFVMTYPARTLDRVLERAGRHHVLVTVPIQAMAVALANLGALWLGGIGAPAAPTLRIAQDALPLLVLIRCALLYPFRLDRDMWRYVGFRELRLIASSVALGSGLFWLLSRRLPAFRAYPASILVLDALLCVVALMGVRVVRRLHRVLRGSVLPPRRVLVVGADESAEAVVRGLAEWPHHNYRVLGLVGPRREALGLRIHDVPILGCYDRLEAILRATDPEEVLILASAVAGARRKELVRCCRRLGRPARIVPGLEEHLAGHENSRRIEPPEAEDLLFREPVQVDLQRLREPFRARRVLITGAGGSIGSEICRQIAACEPASLVMFEKHEASLYHVDRELRASHPGVPLDPVIGDVRDRSRVEEVLAATRPEMIFHAAAYKHVPMMERNPWEAVKTNVLGTKLMADAADRAGVNTFVLVSTDKAVEPACVMGTSKRMAELALQRLAAGSRTRFITVRFGNVLESSGSVIPLFREQIERGGPVTVTHPDVTRWFMTVQEAVQLILTSATMGEGGEVFVLDMGKPVRILDLAVAMIRQYGLRPGRDVPIVFTGLRPGERLFEKLFNDHEMVVKTSHPRILTAVAASRNGNGQLGRSEEIRRLMQLVRRSAGAAAVPGVHGPAEQVESIGA